MWQTVSDWIISPANTRRTGREWEGRKLLSKDCKEPLGADGSKVRRPGVQVHLKEGTVAGPKVPHVRTG